MHTQTATTAVAAIDNGTSNELNGEDIKYWLRELRLDRISARTRIGRKTTRGSRRPHNMTTESARTPQVDLDAFIPGTNVSWGAGMAMLKDYERDTRLFGNSSYTGLFTEDVRFDNEDEMSDMPRIPEGCSADDVIPGTGGWTYGEAFEASMEAWRKANRRH